MILAEVTGNINAILKKTFILINITVHSRWMYRNLCLQACRYYRHTCVSPEELVFGFSIELIDGELEDLQPWFSLTKVIHEGRKTICKFLGVETISFASYERTKCCSGQSRRIWWRFCKCQNGTDQRWLTLFLGVISLNLTNHGLFGVYSS